MRSPFPGMDPYLEDPGGWGGVHDALIALLREELNRRLGPGYIADGGTRVYIISPEEQRWIFPDVFVVETPASQAPTTARGAIATPLRVSLAVPTTVHQPSIVLRDRVNRQVVTIIKLLSPISKKPTPVSGMVPAAREEFLQKRQETMASTTHWLDIDLLRAGERPLEVRGVGDSYVLLKRAGRREADVWPISLRDPLPTIAVALSAGQTEIPLDLQAAIDALFERYRYAELLDYRKPPPAPALALADARWTAAQVQRWQVTESVSSSA
jgi:hypothetical protein